MSVRPGVASCSLLLYLTLSLVPVQSSTPTTYPQSPTGPKSSGFVLHGLSFLSWNIIRNQLQGYMEEGRDNNKTSVSYSPEQIFSFAPGQKNHSLELTIPADTYTSPIDQSILFAVPRKTQQASPGYQVDPVRYDGHMADSLLLLLDIDSHGFWVIVIIKTDASGRPVGQIRIHTRRNHTDSDYKAFLKWLGTHKIVFILSATRPFPHTLNINARNLLAWSECDTGSGQEQKRLFILKSSLHPKFDTEGEDNDPEAGMASFHTDQYDLPTILGLTSKQHRSTTTGSGASEPSESLIHSPHLSDERTNRDGPPPSEYIIESTRDRLLSLAGVLSEKHYVGFITDHLNDKRRFKKVFSILPSLFVNVLHNQFGRLLNIPHSLLVHLLQLISVVSNEKEPSAQARSSLKFFFHTLWQVFDPDIFIPNDRYQLSRQIYVDWTDMALQAHRTDIFEKLMALYQTTWQRDLDRDVETLWLGNHPALRSDIISLVATINQFSYAFHTEPESPDETRSCKKMRNPFVPAWRKYQYQAGSEYRTISLEDYNSAARAGHLEHLENLESGYYTAGRDILHISRFSSHQPYSLYVGPQLSFNFDSTEQLYEFWIRNYPLFILVRALKHSPSYLEDSCLISVNDLTSDESEALQLFGFSIDDLETLDKAQLDKRFRKLALDYHPDHPQGDEEAFKKFLKARDCLAELIKRAGGKKSRSDDCIIL